MMRGSLPIEGGGVKSENISRSSQSVLIKLRRPAWIITCLCGIAGLLNYTGSVQPAQMPGNLGQREKANVVLAIDWSRDLAWDEEARQALRGAIESQIAGFLESLSSRCDLNITYCSVALHRPTSAQEPSPDFEANYLTIFRPNQPQYRKEDWDLHLGTLTPFNASNFKTHSISREIAFIQCFSQATGPFAENYLLFVTNRSFDSADTAALRPSEKEQLIEYNRNPNISEYQAIQRIDWAFGLAERFDRFYLFNAVADPAVASSGSSRGRSAIRLNVFRISSRPSGTLAGVFKPSGLMEYELTSSDAIRFPIPLRNKDGGYAGYRLKGLYYEISDRDTSSPAYRRYLKTESLPKSIDCPKPDIRKFNLRLRTYWEYQDEGLLGTYFETAESIRTVRPSAAGKLAFLFPVSGNLLKIHRGRLFPGQISIARFWNVLILLALAYWGARFARPHVVPPAPGIKYGFLPAKGAQEAYIVRQIGSAGSEVEIGILTLSPDTGLFNLVQRFFFGKIKSPEAILPKLRIGPKALLGGLIVASPRKVFSFSYEGEKTYIIQEGRRLTNDALIKFPVILAADRITDFMATEGGNPSNLPWGFQILEGDKEVLSVPVYLTLVPAGPGEIAIEKAPCGATATAAPSGPDKIQLVEDSSGSPEYQFIHRAELNNCLLISVVFRNKGTFAFSQPGKGFVRIKIFDHQSQAFAAPDSVVLRSLSAGLSNPLQPLAENSEFVFSLASGESRTLELWADFGRYPDPSAAASYEMQLLACEGDEEPFHRTTFVILPDSSKAGLLFVAKAGGRPLKAGDEIKVPWVFGVGGEGYAFSTFTIGNKAADGTRPGGRVEITMAKIDVSVDGLPLDQKNRWFGIVRSDDRIQRLDEPVIAHLSFDNGAKPLTFSVVISIEQIPVNYDDEKSGTIDLTFQYRAFQDPDDTGPLDFSRRYHFRLKRTLTRWLALDFGTSAIAAAILDEGGPRVLRLNESHRDVLIREGETDGLRLERRNLEFDEKESDFLSSLMYLDVRPPDGGARTPNDRMIVLSDRAIKFSPKAEVKKDLAFIDLALPNIKLLLGHESVPLRHAFQVKHAGEVRRDLSVRMILEAAYKNLFSDYIIPEIRKRYHSRDHHVEMLELLRTFGNLVITVPNIFNRSHINTIREIVHNQLRWGIIDESGIVDSNKPLFFDDQIKFVSESDAIACYYLANYDFVAEGETKYLLIYDVGAGTIDISYLKVTFKRARLSIEEIMKIGAVRAGNSVDTVITKIIVWKSGELEITPPIRVFNPFQGNQDEIGRAFQRTIIFKDFIRDHFKIKMSSSWRGSAEDIDFPTEKLNPAEIWNEADFKKIAKAEHFKKNQYFNAYIQSMTKELLKNLKQMVLRCSPDCLDSKKLKVDRIILSGRMSQFEPLRESLWKTLGNLTTVDISTGITALDKALLKKAVVMGALQRVTRFEDSFFQAQGIDAYFGLLWRNGPKNNQYTYKSIFTPGERLPEEEEGTRIFESLNLTYADKIMLIRSYTADPEREFNQNRSEMITKLIEIPKNSIAGDRANATAVVRFDRKCNFMLEVNGFRSISASFQQFSLEENLTYEENTWPYNKMTFLWEETRSPMEQ